MQSYRWPMYNRELSSSYAPSRVPVVYRCGEGVVWSLEGKWGHATGRVWLHNLHNNEHALFT